MLSCGFAATRIGACAYVARFGTLPLRCALASAARHAGIAHAAAECRPRRLRSSMVCRRAACPLRALAELHGVRCILEMFHVKHPFDQSTSASNCGNCRFSIAQRRGSSPFSPDCARHRHIAAPDKQERLRFAAPTASRGAPKDAPACQLDLTMSCNAAASLQSARPNHFAEPATQRPLQAARTGKLSDSGTASANLTAYLTHNFTGVKLSAKLCVKFGSCRAQGLLKLRRRRSERR